MITDKASLLGCFIYFSSKPISMRDRKLQVFVSSTYTDLKEERQAAVEAILSAGHIPAGMELFSAGDESQMTVIKRWIDESDVYMLILGGRYGSTDPETGKSYTQLEYEYAVAQNKPLFAVVISDATLDVRIRDAGLAGQEKNILALNSFRDNVLTKLVKFWDDAKDIKLAIYDTLSEFAFRKDLTGWVKGDQAVNSTQLAEEIARLSKENAELREKLNSKIDTALYNGLSYDELEDLLRSQSCIYDNNALNLFDYLLSNGEKLTRSYSYNSKDEEAVLKKLHFYKVLERVISNGFRDFRFSNDGYNFYIKTLIKHKGE